MGWDWIFVNPQNEIIINNIKEKTIMTNNKYVLDWIDEMAAMTQPDKIVWIDGSEAQAEALRDRKSVV